MAQGIDSFGIDVEGGAHVREYLPDESDLIHLVIDRRTTVFESALFSSSAVEKAELIRKFGFAGDLLDLAVTHELGHAICKDRDERRADDFGRDLRSGHTATCYPNRKNKPAK